MKKGFQCIILFLLICLPKIIVAAPIQAPEHVVTGRLHCVYDSNRAYDVQLIFNNQGESGQRIRVLTYDPGKYQKYDKNCAFCSEDWFIIGQVPEYNLSGVWEESTISYEINYTTKYDKSNNILSSCPDYLAEVIDENVWYDTSIGKEQIADKYIFFDNEFSMNDAQNNGKFGKYKHHKLYKEYFVDADSGNTEEDVEVLPTYETNGNKDTCEIISNGSWKKTCTYSADNKGSDDAAGVSTIFNLYISDNDMTILTEAKNNQVVNINLRFSKKEIMNDCPKELYYSPNNTGTHYILGLEKFTVPFGNKNGYELESRKLKLISSKNNKEQLSVCLQFGMPDISLTPDSLDCVGILGRPDDNISKPPAFYLQTAFTVMKYVAIVILIVFTIMDYASAVSAQDNDAIKKATSKLVTRLIICVILFVLPTLIEFLFKILDIYGDAAHCKIN